MNAPRTWAEWKAWAGNCTCERRCRWQRDRHGIEQFVDTWYHRPDCTFRARMAAPIDQASPAPEEPMSPEEEEMLTLF